MISVSCFEDIFQIVDSLEQAVAGEGVDLEAERQGIGGDGVRFQVYGELEAGFGCLEAVPECGLIHDDGEKAVAQRILVEDVCKFRGDDGFEAVVHDGPYGMLPGASATKVLTGNQ